MKHNKRRNVGIVYEMLARCISESMLEGSRTTASSAMKVLKKYFGKDQPLAKELAIHQAVMSARGVELPLARRIIAEAMREAAELDRRLCDIKKSNLIKEINYGFGQDFFDRFRIPEYRALASVHLLIQSAGSCKSLTEKIDRATLEESVVKFMCSGVERTRTVVAEGRDSVAFKIASSEFKKVYGKALLPEQVALLEAFNVASMGGERKTYRALAENARKGSIDCIGKYLRTEDCKNDPVLSERVNKVLGEISSMKISLSEGCLEDLMNAQGLCAEMAAE